MKNPKANTLLKTKKDAIEFLDWIGLLESDFLEKGTLLLEPIENHYCCLAKGCLVTIPENKLKLHNELLVGLTPMHQSAAPDWLIKINNDFFEKRGVTLADLNDGNWLPEHSHKQIAALLLEVYTDELNQFDWP